MDVYERAWEYAHSLYKGRTPFPRATYLAASKFSDQEGASFHDILRALRKKGAMHSGAQASLAARKRRRPQQLEFPFEDRLKDALGIQE